MRKVILAVFVLLALVFLFTEVNAVCGDGVCSSDEDKCTCAKDCGECLGSVPEELCQKYTCATGLCRSTIVYSCCGNNICEAGEDFANCSIDCPPQEVKIELLSPGSDANYLRGDMILFKVRVKADGVIARQSNVRVDTFVGTIVLYDDGNHNDGIENDGTYANSFLVEKSFAEGNYEAKIIAEKVGVTATKTIMLKIDPSLDLSANLEKDTFLLGGIIDVNGFVKRRGQPLKTTVSFSLYFSGAKLFDGNVSSDKNGFYSFSYHSSLNQPEGVWQLRIHATDSLHNEGLVEKNVFFSLTPLSRYFTVKILSPTEKLFERGKKVKLLVEVSFDEEAVSGAKVNATFPDNTVKKLEEVGNGIYSSEWTVPLNLGIGSQKMFVTARKDINFATFSGSSETAFTITKAEVNVELLSPKERIFGLAERIDFLVKVSYSGGEPVSGARLVLLVGGEKVKVREKKAGVYFASFTASDANKLEQKVQELSVFAEDKYGNAGRFTTTIEIKTELSIEYYLRKDPLLFVSVFFGVIFFLAVLIVFRKRRGKLGALRRRAKELESLKAELQNRYFKKGAVSSDEYYNLLSQYTSELREINASIASLGKKKKIERVPVEEPEEKKAGLFRVAKEPPKKKPSEEQEFKGLFRIKKKKK